MEAMLLRIGGTEVKKEANILRIRLKTISLHTKRKREAGDTASFFVHDR